MQVLVESDDTTASGVIVSQGRARIGGFMSVGTGQSPTWIVEFDEPFYAPDGSGPHESAEVSEKYLAAAPSDDSLVSF